MLHIKAHKVHFASTVIFTFLLLFSSTHKVLAQENKPKATPKKPAHKVNTNKPSTKSNKVDRTKSNNFYFCKAIDPSDIKKPNITIVNVKQSSSLQGGKYKVKGIIDGTCLKEAGLYENGERIFKFNLDTSPTYTRVDFEIEVNYDNNPEIRAFDINWQRASKMLLKNVTRKNS